MRSPIKFYVQVIAMRYTPSGQRVVIDTSGGTWRLMAALCQQRDYRVNDYVGVYLENGKAHLAGIDLLSRPNNTLPLPPFTKGKQMQVFDAKSLFNFLNYNATLGGVTC